MLSVRASTAFQGAKTDHTSQPKVLHLSFAGTVYVCKNFQRIPLKKHEHASDVFLIDSMDVFLKAAVGGRDVVMLIISGDQG